MVNNELKVAELELVDLKEVRFRLAMLCIPELEILLKTKGRSIAEALSFAVKMLDWLKPDVNDKLVDVKELETGFVCNSTGSS